MIYDMVQDYTKFGLFLVHIIEKKLKNVFDFWKVGEVQRAAIFCLRCHENIGLDLEPNLSGYHFMNLIHLLMLWKTKLDHRFGNDVLK